MANTRSPIASVNQTMWGGSLGNGYGGKALGVDWGYNDAPVSGYAGTAIGGNPPATSQGTSAGTTYIPGVNVGLSTPATVSNVPTPSEDAYSKRMLAMSTGKFDATDPSYQWRFNEGQRALERSAAAKGQLGSGNIMQELVSYGQGMASTEYAAEFDRMLRASQHATTQYDSAIKGLASMAGIDYNRGMLSVAGRNADANMLGAQASMRSAEASVANAGTNQANSNISANNQRYLQELQSGKDAAAQDALWKMYNTTDPDTSLGGGWVTYTGTGEVYNGFAKPINSSPPAASTYTPGQSSYPGGWGTGV